MFKSRRAIRIALLFALIFSSKITALFADSRIIFSDPSILNSEYVDISQRWDYYSDLLIPAEDFYPNIKNMSGTIVDIPHVMKDGVKTSTYHIRLTGLIPNERYSTEFLGSGMTSSRIWCNGKIVATGGFLSREKKLSKPGDIFSPVDFQADSNGIVDIVIHIANFEKCNGGIAKRIKLTSFTVLRRKIIINYLLNAFILAFCLAHILYNMFLGSLNFKQLSYISLILIFLFYCCGASLTGYSVLLSRGIILPFYLHRKMAVLVLCFACAFELLYILNMQKVSFKKSAVIFSLVMANALTATFVPLNFFERTRWLFVDIALYFSVVSFLIPLRFILKRNFDNRKKFQKSTIAYNVNSFSTLLIFCCRAYDFLIIQQNNTPIHSFILFKISMLIFGISQCGIYAFNRDYSSTRVKRQMDKLSFSNNTLTKVVPQQVLKLLGASDITKIIPGESRIIDALLLYVEIKHFNRMVESINKEELYSIQTDFFLALSPIINDSGGFVAKYSISGCLAIFQNKNTDAIICASRLQNKIREIRRDLRKTKRTDISIGIAIHYGKVAVGSIGSNSRLDTMVLSEDVNITYMVGKQTSKTNTQILITEEAMTYCRNYINYVYEGHFFISNGNQILVYSALPIKKNEQAFEETLEAIEDDDEI